MVYIFNSKTCDGGAELKDILGNKCVSFSLFPNDYDYERVGYAASARKEQTHRGTRFFIFEGKKYEPFWTRWKMLGKTSSLPSLKPKRVGEEVWRRRRRTAFVLGKIRRRRVHAGMLETVLNIGLNKSVCEKIAAANGGANKRFAYDAYRRLLDMFGSVVFEMDRSQFEMELERVKEKKGVEKDTELSAEDLMEVCDAYEQVYLKVDPNRPFPSDPTMQLKLAIEAVFESWNKPRAKAYRDRRLELLGRHRRQRPIHGLW